MEHRTGYVAELRQALRNLGRRIQSGDESQLLIWVLPSRLACCHRPLRYSPLYGGSARNLDSNATPLVLAWADRVRAEGIQSIICLMSPEELSYYQHLELGAVDLLDFYRARGFAVASIPWKDPPMFV